METTPLIIAAWSVDELKEWRADNAGGSVTMRSLIACSDPRQLEQAVAPETSGIVRAARRAHAGCALSNGWSRTLSFDCWMSGSGRLPPVATGGQVIQPTTDWQIMPLSLAKEAFDVATELYYINVVKQ